MKTYSRLTLVLTFLLLPIASGILFTAPTFGDSLSGSETFDAQQFLSEAKAQQVAEAGKQGALIGFIVSLVIAYVMSPIDQQRWLKVVMVIVWVTGGYFGSTFGVKNSGVSSKVAFELQSRMGRAAVKLAVLESDKEIMRLDRVGPSTVGLQNIVDQVRKIQHESATASTTENQALFENQLQRMVPALQKQVDAIVALSDDTLDFTTKFGGAGAQLVQKISAISGIPWQDIMEGVLKKIKAQNLEKQINKDDRESMKRQAVATQFADAAVARKRLTTGRTMTIGTGSSARVVGMGALDEDQMKRFSDPMERANLEKLRAGRKKEGKLASLPAGGSRLMTRSQKARADNAAQEEQDAIDTGRSDDAKKWGDERSKIYREVLERNLGKENVTDADVATATRKSYDSKDPASFSKFIKSRRKSIADEGVEARKENAVLEQGLMTGAGALNPSELMTLLQNPQLFEALAKDIDLYMKSMPKEKSEPVEDTKQVTPGSAQKPTAAEKIQSSNPQKRSNRRRRMKTR